jgi:hypothetical protein
MSFLFNCISSIDLQPSIIHKSWKRFPTITHKYTFGALHDLIRLNSLLLPKSFPWVEFWKIKLDFLFQKWFYVYLIVAFYL